MQDDLSKTCFSEKSDEDSEPDEINADLKEIWRKEQKENREKLNLFDTEPWQMNRKIESELIDYSNFQNDKLRYVAGLDISFVKNEKTACAGLFIFDLADDFKCVYQDIEIVTMNQPYVAGFLAYREAPFLLEKLEKLKQSCPKFYPNCILIDGNGLLHGNKFGLACHIGYYSNTPTIGISKKLYQVFGLENNREHKEKIKNELKKSGDYFELRSKVKGDETLLGYCYRSTDLAPNPIYVSIGNKIGWDTCLWVLKLTITKYRIPEPIRQADLRTRRFLTDLNKN